jgi:proteasome assembly chaperone (PAC2) family protein
MADALRMHVLPSLRDPALVLAFAGWNDAGEAATSAARYVADSLHAVPLAEIDPEEFYDFTVRRPHVRLDPGARRRIEWPRNEFLFASMDAEREIVIGIGAEPHLRWNAFSDQVEKLADDLGVRQVVLLGAFLADVVYSRPVGLTGFASPPDLLDKLSVQPSAYQGPTGIVAVVADRLMRSGREVVSLWAGLPHYISVAPNPRGALALLGKLREALGLKLDETPLRVAAAEFEERISSLVAADPEISEYVRQLKRREFAQ